MLPRRPFRHEARSPRVRTHSFAAQPPDLHHFALATRASRLLARSPCLAVPHIRFLFIGSRFTLHASSPRSVTLPQLRFTSFAVASSREDLHLQECARAGRTKKPPRGGGLSHFGCSDSVSVHGKFRRGVTTYPVSDQSIETVQSPTPQGLIQFFGHWRIASIEISVHQPALRRVLPSRISTLIIYSADVTQRVVTY